MKRKIPCFILARKNSKGLINKNIYKFDKIPLIVHTINYAKKIKFITNIVISTDDIRIKNIAKKYNCDVIFPRPKKLSNDTASSLSALKHAIKEFENIYGRIDILSYLQATEPLRPKNILNKCFKYVIKNNYNSAFAGFVYHKNFWIKSNKYNYKLITPQSETKKSRQYKKNIYRGDFGVSLVTKRDVVLKNNSLIKKPFKIVPYNEYSGLLDIHTKKDIVFGEMLKTFIKKQKN